MNCKNCKKQGCSLAGKNHEMSFECKAYIGKTNADRIRQMSDEELADLIGTHDCLDCPLNNEDDWCAGSAGSCRGNVLEWLKSPVEVDE